MAIQWLHCYKTYVIFMFAKITMYKRGGSVVKCLPCEWGILGLIPNSVTPMIIKMVTDAFLLSTKHLN